MASRTARINTLRGFGREFGLAVTFDAPTCLEAIGRTPANLKVAIPPLLVGSMTLLIEETRLLEQRIAQLEKELTDLARHSEARTRLRRGQQAHAHLLRGAA